MQPTDIVLEKEEKWNDSSVGFHLLSFGSDENMPYNMNYPELSSDTEDSRTGYILSTRDECAEKKKEFQKKKERERIACAARKYFATDSTSQAPKMKY